MTVPEDSDQNLFASDLLCHLLPTSPVQDLGTVLVTGASGYIGGRLVPELLVRGYLVRTMVRSRSGASEDLWPGSEVVEADALSGVGLEKALAGIDTAYYLIHSLQLGPAEFEAADQTAARNFRRAADECGVKRIIYLGGLGDVRQELSLHLRSRIAVANELKAGTIPVTVLRAGMIIGSGSASYEMLLHIVKKLRVIPAPSWSNHSCQPISIRDVIRYLVGVLEEPKTAGNDYCVGGSDILTYRQMVRELADILQRKIFVVPSPISSVRLFGYLASLITPVPNAISQCLMGGILNDVVCLDQSIQKLLNFRPISYREAIIRALSREEQDRVATRWSDAFPPAFELSITLGELDGETTFTTSQSLVSTKTASKLFFSACRVGGKDGWFHGNWMWKLRGMVDRILTGVGTSRGRKNYGHLRVDDVIDFWRIEDIRSDERLLLRAEMKLPGQAWLEFRIQELAGHRKLSVTAYHDTHTLRGRTYWYAFMPFHHFIFKHLIEDIEARA